MNKYYIWLSLTLGEGNQKAAPLLAHFGSPDAVWAADYNDFLSLGLASGEIAKLLVKNMERVNQIVAECKEKSIGILTLEEAHYPERLREISNPPLVLYYRGDIHCIADTLTIAIVGTRAATTYGLQCAEKIAGGLAKTGFLIVSGMADGIDCAANIGAIKAGGKTIAVLGNGVDRAFPTRNGDLMDKIILDSGVVISEYPPKAPGLKHHFPLRNRIISGLSYGVLIVEASERSGALITARLALEQDRDLFVIPGNINSEQSRGTLNLLKENCAKPVTEALDIIREYIEIYPHKMKHMEVPKPKIISREPYKRQEFESLKVAVSQGDYEVRKETRATANAKTEFALSETEKQILALIAAQELTIQELIVHTALPVNRLIVALTMLETKGYIQALAGSRYRSNFTV